MIITRPIPLVALAGLAIAGCNDDVPFFPNPDATTSDATSDSGAAPDGGVTPDTGVTDTGTGPVVDVGSDTSSTPDIVADASSNATLGAALLAFCEAATVCVERPTLVNRCLGYFSDVEAAFDAQTEACQEAILSYLGCAAESEEACYDDDGDLSFDGERGCETEYALQNELCPTEDY